MTLQSPYFSPNEDTSIPALNYNKAAIILHPKDNTVLYTTFYNNLKNFIVKIPSSTARSAVQELIERNVIYLARNASTESKSGVTGGFVSNPTGKLSAIALDVVNFGIDVRTGETTNIDGCFYASYLHYIRAGIILNAGIIKRDEDLHELTTKYYFYLMLRLLGKNVILNDKQKIFLELVTKYFYYRFFIGQGHPLAVESSLKDQTKEIITETKDIFDKFKRYSSIKDIFKAFIDFHIALDSPQTLIVSAISKFKPTTFQAFMSSVDYLIGMAVVGKYPTTIFQGALIDSALQNKLEQITTGYIHKVGFDPII